MTTQLEISNVQAAISSLMQEVRERRRHDGAWEGRLSSSALSTATAIIAMSLFLEATQAPENHTIPRIPAAEIEELAFQIQSGLASLVKLQRSDGGWGDTAASYSNISTTLLTLAAFHASGKVPDYRSVVDRAWQTFQQLGGIEGVRRRYGTDRTFSVPILAASAMVGLVPWKEVPALPFEATLIPQKFFHWLRLPVVSYAIPALVAIGQAKFCHDPPRNPLLLRLRRRAIVPGLKLLEKMQPESGGFLEAVPLTSFVVMGLLRSGRMGNPVVTKGIQFLMSSFREDGTWPIDTNLATWATTLTLNSMTERQLLELKGPEVEGTIHWLLCCQHKRRHPFTNAAPGGWGWTDLSGAVPDADDTPGALLALQRCHLLAGVSEQVKREIGGAARLAVDWLLGVQNRDGGWPTFCRGWGRLPFDRSGSDITAHVIRGLGRWRGIGRSDRIDLAIGKGFRFLAKLQRLDGSWIPLWFGNQDQKDEENPWYGTSKVLMAYFAEGLFDTKPAQNGLNWIRRTQHPDGSWGGGASIRRLIPELGCGSLEESALCLEALLLADREVDREAILRGGHWLLRAIAAKDYKISRPIGLYFAKLWYDEQHYPVVFGLSALNHLENWVVKNQVH